MREIRLADGEMTVARVQLPGGTAIQLAVKGHDADSGRFCRLRQYLTPDEARALAEALLAELKSR